MFLQSRDPTTGVHGKHLEIVVTFTKICHWWSGLELAVPQSSVGSICANGQNNGQYTFTSDHTIGTSA